MGYRSDIRIVTSKEGFEKLREFVIKYLEKEKIDIKEFNLLDYLDVKSEGKNQCYFGWNYVKWYENDYKEVDAIMEGLEYLENNNFSYRYIRIGEDKEDYDEKYYDGDKENIYLEYPNLIREFDDDYVINYLEEPLKSEIEENKEEIDI